MQSEKSPLSPRVPTHTRSNTGFSYGSVKTFNSTSESLSASFHESFINRFNPAATVFYNDGEIEKTIAHKRPWFRRIYCKLSKLVFEWWLWEIMSWAMSTLCMCGMATVLGLFHGQALPARWPGGVTLNAYISVLSGAAKFTMAVPLDSAFGQLKWLWFRSDRARNLVDFERFDNASRGPWGALTLLISGGGRSLASLGALIAILSLALDPFFQQVVSYPQRPGPLQLSSVDRALGYTPNGLIQYRNGSQYITADLLLETYLFAYFLGNGSQPDPPYDCPSGQCSWAPYKTLGICSSCVDASHLLSFDCLQELGDWLPSMGGTRVPMYQNVTQYPGSYSCGYFMAAGLDGRILMNGYSLGSNSSPNSSTAGEALLLRLYEMQNYDSNGYNWEGTGHFSNIQSPYEHFIVVSGVDAASVYANVTPAAQECMLSWCEKTINSSFSKGQYSEEIISSFVGMNNTQIPAPYLTRVEPGPIKQYELLQNITVFGSEPNTTYLITQNDQFAARFTIGDFLPAFGTVQNSTASLQLMRDWRPGYIPESSSLSSNAWAPPNNISAHVADLATTLTNVIRTTGNNIEKVFGDGIPETFIYISWGWFVLPLVLEFATLVLLLATIRRSRMKEDVAIWKCSSLATLAHGLSHNVRSELGHSRNIIEFRHNAQNVSVHLRVTEDGFKLDRPENMPQFRASSWQRKNSPLATN